MLKTLSILLPNPSQAASLFRSGLQILGTYLATRGVVDGGTWEVIAGPLLVLGVTAYGSLYKRTAVNLVATAAKVPGVEKIEAVVDLALSVPSAKVVIGPRG